MQDTESQSSIVRFYYQHRLFMGFCCICCEVLYLSLYLLHFPDFQTWPAVPLHPPPSLRQHLPGQLPDTPQPNVCNDPKLQWQASYLSQIALISITLCAGEEKGQEGVPLALVIAVLAVPGFALKQFINCIQLQTAMQQLVATDRDKLGQQGQAARSKLDALSKAQ